jgi:formiminoglutamase
MHSTASIWQGRNDKPGEGPLARRWHQVVQPWQPIEQSPGHVLLGFCCDEGVRRNHGRVGASDGPDTLRQALCNLAWHHSSDLLDAGNLVCANGHLEAAQEMLRQRASVILERMEPLIVLGGGHETAWGSFQAIRTVHEASILGIINIDSHFDLRPAPPAHSGTPFTQMAMWAQANKQPFRYLCLGIASASNTTALFHKAESVGTQWISDESLQTELSAEVIATIDRFIQSVDHLYLSLDLDVLPASVMPAVSAPAGLGVPMHNVMQLITRIATSRKLLLADVVEYNPSLDEQGIGARAAARLIWHLVQHWPLSR